MNETQYISSDFLTPRDAWDKLSIEEQAAMMKAAVSEGILDLGTIRQKYNEFAEGGNTDDDLVDWIIREEGFLASPQDIGDGKMTLGSGLTAQKWHDQYKRKGNKWTSSDNRRAVREEVANRRRWAEKNIPNWNSLPSSSQKALLSYKYNYNFNRTNSPKLFKALADSNLQEAARQMDATSSNPIFKKGLQARRQREQEWFLSDVTPKPVVASTIPFEQPVSTIIVNPYVPQVENTRVAPIMVPDEDSYVTAHRLTEAEEKRQKFQERMEAISNFNRLLQMTSLDSTAVPAFMPTTGNTFLDSMIGLTKAEGGSIHIKPENRGKFTALKERTGHSATWFKEHGTPAQKKMAVFALNSRHWKHGLGGNLFSGEEDGSQKMQIGLKATNGWKPFTLGDVLANATRIEQQKQAMEDRLSNVFTLSNDATSVINGRPQNRHLERKAIEGARAHRAWEEEHPHTTITGNLLGAVPFAVAASPLLAAAGETTYPLLTNPYVDATMTSLGGAHATQSIANGEADAFTAIEVLPLFRLPKATTTEAPNLAKDFNYLSPESLINQNVRTAYANDKTPLYYFLADKQNFLPLFKGTAKTVIGDRIPLKPLEEVVARDMTKSSFSKPTITNHHIDFRKYLGVDHENILMGRNGEPLSAYIPRKDGTFYVNIDDGAKRALLFNYAQNKGKGLVDVVLGSHGGMSGKYENGIFHFEDVVDYTPLERFKFLPKKIREFEPSSVLPGAKPFKWSDDLFLDDTFSRGIFEKMIEHGQGRGPLIENVTGKAYIPKNNKILRQYFTK